MSTVSASLVVRFGASASAMGRGRLSAEIDSRPDGLNNGKTSFSPGDSVGFLVYAGAGVTLTRVVPSVGAVGSVGPQSVPITEFVQFANSKEANLRAPVSGGISAQWVGLDGGAVSVANGVVTLPQESVGVLYASYTATALGYMLSNVPSQVVGLTEFEVLVYIEGEYNG